MEDKKKSAFLSYSSFPGKSQLQLTAQSLLAIVEALPPSPGKIFGYPSPHFSL